jgi:phytanoyl-CoA hydroxylase
MYVPIITGKYMPKDENSKTPFYHRFASKVQN